MCCVLGVLGVLGGGSRWLLQFAVQTLSAKIMEKTLVFKSKPLMTLMSLHAKESQHLRRERRRRRRRSAIKQYQCDLNQRKTTASLPACQLN